MGVIIAVIIWPNGAEFVVIPERYPQEGAQSSRLTAATARNTASGSTRLKRYTVGRAGRDGAGRAGVCRRAEPESLVVRRATISAAAAAMARATTRMPATAAALRLTAMPEPMPL